jgi:peptide/nickel transport system substrate-binding protein
VFNSDPPTLNPILATESYESAVNGLVMERLLARDNATLEHTPRLAQRWDISDDHLTYTFYLRNDVRWHDGAKFTAADVVYSFNLINDPKTGALNLLAYFAKAGITKAEAVDEYTVRFRLDRPYFFAIHPMGWMPIIPKHLYDVKDVDLRKNPANFHPIGTGPMRFKEWKRGRHIKIARNPDYWGHPTDYNGVTFRIIPEDTVAFQAMKKGQVDLAGVRPIQWARQTSSDKFQKRFRRLKYMSPGRGYSYLGWKNDHPLFKDKHVRQALTMLIPRERMAKTLLYDLVELCTGPFHPYGPQIHPDVKPWPYDPLLARQLLKRVGWEDHDGDGWLDKDGRKFQFTISYTGPHPYFDDWTNIIRENMQKVGIQVDIRSMEWSVFLKTIHDFQFEAYLGFWGGGDYETDPYQLWHSSSADSGGSNYVQFKNAQIDQLIADARVEFNDEKRMAMWHEFHKIIHDEQPYTFFFDHPTLMVRHHRFTNAKLYPAGLDIELWGVGPSEVLFQ